MESARDVELVSRIMGDSPAPSQVWALIESPRAIQNLTSILRARSSPGWCSGAADYAAEAGCKITSRAVWYPRVMLAAAAATVVWFEHPVHVGDTLRAQSTVLAARRSNSRRDQGIVTCRIEGHHQHYRWVLSCTRTFFVPADPGALRDATGY